MIHLKLKCPECGESLMDKNKLIDGKESCHFKIKFNNKEGNIWMSSFYGSYNIESDIDIPDETVVEFLCPECNTVLYDGECQVCGSPMVKINLEEGGTVRFCSKKNCKNHLIDFARPEIALKMLYRAYNYDNKVNINDENFKKLEQAIKKQQKAAKENKEIIKNGTFLYTYCPHCKHSLNKDNEVELIIVNKNGERGLLHLSPYLNVFNHKSTIRLPEGEAVEDLLCPHCEQSIVEENEEHKECSEKIAKILVTTSTKLVDFYFCVKPGCKWHGIKKEDEQKIILEDSYEW